MHVTSGTPAVIVTATTATISRVGRNVLVNYIIIVVDVVYVAAGAVVVIVVAVPARPGGAGTGSQTDTGKHGS
jgi:hypothetical protein